MADQATISNSNEEAFAKGKGKADPTQDMSMDEDSESESENEIVSLQLPCPPTSLMLTFLRVTRPTMVCTPTITQATMLNDHHAPERPSIASILTSFRS